MVYRLHIRLKKDFIIDGDQRYAVFYGSAQFEITYSCMKYILSFYEKHPMFNRYFKAAFAPDESYFASIVMNSKFSNRTINGGPEKAKRGLINWQNLYYFEYN